MAMLGILYTIEKRLVKSDEVHRNALKEAGNAITETLSVAFDNLKKHTTTIAKHNSVLSEHTKRIHRLEQQGQKTAAQKSRIEAVKQAAKNRAPNDIASEEDDNEQ